jgi:hypothetical protein
MAVGFLLAMGSAPGARAGTTVAPGAWVPSAPYLMLAKKKKKPAAAEEEPGPRLTPDAAEPKRQAIRDAVQPARDAGNLAEVADGLERNAAQLGDPVTMLEAAEARLEAAKKDRKTDTAEAAIETSKRSLDILHFYAAVNNGEATSDWLVIEPGDAGGLIDRADGVVRDAEALIEEIEAEDDAEGAAAPADGGKKAKKKRKKGEAKPGTGMIAAGSVFTLVGVAGVSMVVAGTVISAGKQNDVEKFSPGDPEVDKLDDEGKRANLIAYIGAGVAVAGFAVGLPLIIIGAKKRKQGKAPPASASTRSSLVLAPVFGGGTAALSLRGRF